MSVLAAGRRAALIFGHHELLADFELLTFEGSAGRLHRLTASWHLKQRSYNLTW